MFSLMRAELAVLPLGADGRHSGAVGRKIPLSVCAENISAELRHGSLQLFSYYHADKHIA